MLFEFSHFIRQIYTDGRKHNTDLGPTWLGDAIGHWDGDTLVVDTIGFNDKTWVDRAGHPHSTDMHLTERIRRVDEKTLTDDITIEDPKAYTKPWGGQITFAVASHLEHHGNGLRRQRQLRPVPEERSQAEEVGRAPLHCGATGAD